MRAELHAIEFERLGVKFKHLEVHLKPLDVDYGTSVSILGLRESILGPQIGRFHSGRE